MFKTSNTTVPSQRFSQAMSFEIPVSTTDSLERANQWVEAANGEKLKKNGISKEWLKTTIQKMGPTTALETFGNLPAESPAIAYYVKNGRSPETLAVMANCRELQGDKDGADKYVDYQKEILLFRRVAVVLGAMIGAYMTGLTLSDISSKLKPLPGKILALIIGVAGSLAAGAAYITHKKKIALWEAHRTRRHEYYDQKIQTATSK